MRLSLIASLSLAAVLGIGAMAVDTPNADARTVVVSGPRTVVATRRPARVAVVRRGPRGVFVGRRPARFAMARGLRGARGSVIVRRPGFRRFRRW